MTTRGVGAGLIDLTRNDVPSDQLTAYYPAGGRYAFIDDSLVKIEKSDGAVTWSCRSTSSLAGDKSECTVEYRLRDGDPFVTCTVRISGDDLSKLQAFDSVRADRTFGFSSLKGTSTAFCEDETFRQTYGFQAVVGQVTPKWGSGRARRLTYPDGLKVDDDGSVFWQTRIYPTSSPLDLLGLTKAAAAQTFRVRGAVGDQPRVKFTVLSGDVSPLKPNASWRTEPAGDSVVHLPAGRYTIRVDAIGHAAAEKELVVSDRPASHSFQLGPASTVTATITSAAGGEIPCKVSFYGLEMDGAKTPDPNFGLDSQDGSVGNTVYSADGKFVRSIPPGAYEAVISYGPEYDAVFQKISVPAGGNVDLVASLQRVVDTRGWVSAELHSHSTPSGDNTSSQLGRVENLLCEQLEFCPCTEHQRVESYDDQLEILGATHLMATCSGMELTGNLLPINHQNAFPMKWKPYAQDGGGPRIDNNPVTQIAQFGDVG